MGSIIGFSRPNADVMYVLWDGRNSIDSIWVGYVEIVEDLLEGNSVNLAMALGNPDKLKLLQYEASKRHTAIVPVVVKKDPIPKAPREKKIAVVKEKVEKVVKPKPEKPIRKVVQNKNSAEFKMFQEIVEKKERREPPKGKYASIFNNQLVITEDVPGKTVVVRAIYNPADRLKKSRSYLTDN
jgi:hypothetical protein